jgi:hypothetical protein
MASKTPFRKNNEIIHLCLKISLIVILRNQARTLRLKSLNGNLPVLNIYSLNKCFNY